MDRFFFKKGLARHVALTALALLATLAVLAVGFAGCSDDTASPPPNENPTIQLTVNKLATTKMATMTLTAVVSDVDEDEVTVNWQVLRDGQPSGELREADQGSPSMRWTAPNELGCDSIIATASDGNGGQAVATETILVGTLRASSILTASATWGIDGSPYVLRPGGLSFAIEGRATLTIDPGVKVYIDKAGLNISVVGKLMADGTAAEPVVIRPNAKSAEAGEWQGITASPSGGVPVIDLSHTEVFYAVDAVKANETAEVMLDGCLLKFNRDHAVLHQSSGMLTVDNCAITNNKKTGIRIKRGPGVDNPEQVFIRGDSIAVNGDMSGGTVYVEDAGIVIDIDDPSGRADIDISCNEISRNGVPGILLVNAVYPSIHHNGMFGNERGKTGANFNIRLDDGFGGIPPTLDARNNYWGAPFPDPADSLLIKKNIRDIEKAPGAGITVQVIVGPWLGDWPDASCQ